MTLRILPRIVGEDGVSNIPDEVVLYIWNKFVEEGKVETVFFNGVISTPQEWLTLFNSPHVFPVVIMDDDPKPDVVWVSWLNQVSDGWAWAHFCAFGRYRKGVGDMVMDYLSRLGLVGLIGVIPAWNVRAMRMIRSLGWEFSGVLPGLCNTIFLGKRSDGHVHYYRFGGRAHGRVHDGKARDGRKCASADSATGTG